MEKKEIMDPNSKTSVYLRTIDTPTDELVDDFSKILVYSRSKDTSADELVDDFSKILVYSRSAEELVDYISKVDSAANYQKFATELDVITWAQNGDNFKNVIIQGKPLLQFAAFHRYAVACEILLDKGAEVNDSGLEYACPLYYACLSGSSKVIKLLLSRGADANLKSEDGSTPFIASFLKLSSENNVLPLLVDAGANINEATISLDTPLHFAALYSTTAIVESLIILGGQVNARNKSGKSPLTVAMLAGQHTVGKANLLIENGASVNLVNNYGQSCLYDLLLFSTFNCDLIITLSRLLFNNGFDIHMSDNLGRTILHINKAFRNKLIPLLQLIFDNGLDINVKDKFGVTPLHHCLSFGGEDFIETVKFMLDQGASPNNKSDLGRTPLFNLIFSSTGHFMKPYCYNREREFQYIIEMLVNQGASLNAQDDMGCTILHFSCYNDIISTNKYFLPALLKSGIDVNMVDNYGVSSLHMSTHPDIHGFIDELLKRKDLNVNVTDQYGATPVHWAAWHGNTQALTKLINCGGDLLLTDLNGKSAIDVLIQHNHIHLTKFVPVGKELTYGPHLRINNNGNVDLYINDAKTNNVDEFLNAVLKFPGIGKVETIQRNIMVETEISHFMERLVMTIKSLDERFAMTILPSGSVKEGTKCGYPDEFDFMLVLDRFSSVSEALDEVKPYPISPGFVFVRQNENISEEYMEFFETNGFLRRISLVGNLYRLIYAVCEQSGHLLTEHIMLVTKSEELSLTGASINIKLGWRCSYYKDFTINIDLVPVLRLGHFWQSNTRSLTNICHALDLESIGCHVALLKHKDMSFCCRVSYTCCEEFLLQNLSEAHRNGYILAKALRNLRAFDEIDKKEVTSFPNPADSNDELCLSSLSSEISSYALKTALFHIIEEETGSDLLDSISVCRRIYQFLQESCGNCDEDIALPAFLVPDMLYWSDNNMYWDSIYPCLQFVNDVLLKS